MLLLGVYAGVWLVWVINCLRLAGGFMLVFKTGLWVW